MKSDANLIRMLAAVFALTLLIPAASLAQEASWFFNDGPDGLYMWEDTAIGPFWEYMGPDLLGPQTECSWTDLLTGQYYQPYYACSEEMNTVFVDKHFWAEIYLDDSWNLPSGPVSATLGTGVCGQEGSFAAVAGPVWVNPIYSGTWDCGLMYTFDFGVLAELIVANASLIVKIDHPTDDGGTTHIFWDSECCPSALHMAPGTAVRGESWSSVKGLYR